MQHAPTAISNTAFICGLLADGQGRRGSASAPFISLFSRFISAVSVDIISTFVHFSFLRLMAITIFLLTVLLCVSTPAQLILYFQGAYRFYAPAKPEPSSHAPYSLYRAPLFPNKNTGSEFSFAAGVNLMIAHVTL